MIQILIGGYFQKILLSHEWKVWFKCSRELSVFCHYYFRDAPWKAVLHKKRCQSCIIDTLLKWNCTQTTLLYSDKRKQVTNHPNLRKWCFAIGLTDLAYSTSILSLEQKHSPCWMIFKSRHHDIALMSMDMADTFCSFTRNVISRVASFCQSTAEPYCIALEWHNCMHVQTGQNLQTIYKE